MTRIAKRLHKADWRWAGENWRGCIKEVWWRDPKDGKVVQQRTAVQRMKKRV